MNNRNNKNKDSRVAVFMPAEISKHLKIEAENNCRSLTGHIKWILQNHVAERLINESNTAI